MLLLRLTPGSREEKFNAALEILEDVQTGLITVQEFVLAALSESSGEPGCAAVAAL